MAEQVQRANTELENWISGMPGPVADFFSWALTPLRELLEYVSGDPDDLIRAAQVWADAAEQVRQYSSEHKSDGEKLLQTWKDDAAEAFKGMQDQLEKAGQSLAQGMDNVKELLVTAANGAVEAFNLILDLIIDVVLFILTDFIISAALSVISFGASIAAWIAKSLAGLARAGAKIASILQKVANFLMKIAKFLQQIAKLAKEYKAMLKAMKTAKKATSIKTMEGIGARIEYSMTRMPFVKGFNALSPVDIPGMGGLGKDIWNLGEDAVEGSGQEQPEGFDESTLNR